jgi:hypothetical protein
MYPSSVYDVATTALNELLLSGRALLHALLSDERPHDMNDGDTCRVRYPVEIPMPHGSGPKLS